MPNNSKSLWHAVKIAKNLGESEIPENMLFIIRVTLNAREEIMKENKN